MFAQVFRPALVLLAVMTILTGLAYPLVVTGIAQVFFPHAAGGSLIYSRDRLVGSALVGQPFDDARFFWSRPSATGPMPYNAAASSGSNLGPIEPNLIEAFKTRAASLQAADPEHRREVPVDLITASGSGLDPHISPAGAEYQVARVAQARNLDEKLVRDLVREHTAGRALGILGEPRVNVLELNLALERLSTPSVKTGVKTTPLSADSIQ